MPRAARPSLPARSGHAARQLEQDPRRAPGAPHPRVRPRRRLLPGSRDLSSPGRWRPGRWRDLVLDPSLTETLAGLGIRTETLAALTLIPLVKVAWADEHLDEEERRAVLRGAESVGIAQDSPGHALLRAWLEEQPDPRIFEAWRDFVAALCARLSIEGQLELREDLLGRAREVAEAAGGFLGVRSISRREETVLRELESVFPV